MKDKVEFLGYVPEEDLPGLFDQASGLMMMSFYEGFGLPLIEAYSRKVPVLASDIPVFREAMGDSATYTDPNNPENIAQGIAETIVTQANPDPVFIEKYNWNNAAAKLVSVISK